MSPRSLRTLLAYRRYRKSHPKGCGFCLVRDQPTDQLVSRSDSMMVLRNRFPYNRWDGWRVGDHLMVVPSRHITSLTELTAQEEAELIRILAEYDQAGYSFYHRSHANASRSMPHIHGHLIKSRD